MDSDQQRAQRLLDQVRQGKTIFFKAGPEWDIIGPAADVQLGQPVTAIRQDGTTVQVIPTVIHAERTVEGVDTRTASFREAERPRAVQASWDPAAAQNAVDLAAKVVAWTRSEHESAAACDYHVSIEGIGPGPIAGALIYDVAGQVYALATEGFEGSAEAREARYLALWDLLLPELQAYERRCKARRFAGWSNADRGPIRYAGERPTEIRSDISVLAKKIKGEREES